MEHEVPFVGLTGGMGAGKSTALEALRRLGAAVLSTDAVVHELYQQPQLRDAVVERWGAQVAPGGQVDRAAVAQRAFASDEDRRWLEGLLWPLVGARVAAWLAEARSVPGSAPRPRAAVVGRKRRVAAARARERARARTGGRARGAPAQPGGEGAQGDVRRAQRRQQGGSGARAVSRA